jgi:hypothetical protein
MEALRIVLCALLLAPLAVAAQDEPAAEEAPAEETTEAEPAEEQPTEEAAAGETAAEAEPADEGDAASLSGSYVDAYYVPTTALTLKAPGALGATERGDGMGGRGMFRVFHWLAVTGEYQQRQFDDVDDDLTETSGGIGFTAHTDAGDLGGIFFEYDKFDSDGLELDGYSAHVRLSRQPNGWFSFYGDLGFLMLQDDVEDHEGAEFTIGLTAGTRMFRVFADWHFVDLEGETSGTRSQFGDARVGARFTF